MREIWLVENLDKAKQREVLYTSNKKENKKEYTKKEVPVSCD